MQDDELKQMEQQIIMAENRPRGLAGIFATILPIAVMEYKLGLGLGPSFSKKTERGKVIAGSNTGKPYHKKTDVGRNELCPCGSGKKFKHCCLNK